MLARAVLLVVKDLSEWSRWAVLMLHMSCFPKEIMAW